MSTWLEHNLYTWTSPTFHFLHLAATKFKVFSSTPVLKQKIITTIAPEMITVKFCQAILCVAI